MGISTDSQKKLSAPTHRPITTILGGGNQNPCTKSIHTPPVNPKTPDAMPKSLTVARSYPILYGVPHMLYFPIPSPRHRVSVILPLPTPHNNTRPSAPGEKDAPSPLPPLAHPHLFPIFRPTPNPTAPPPQLPHLTAHAPTHPHLVDAHARGPAGSRSCGGGRNSPLFTLLLLLLLLLYRVFRKRSMCLFMVAHAFHIVKSILLSGGMTWVMSGQHCSLTIPPEIQLSHRR